MRAEALFWKLAEELQAEDDRITVGTIMNRPCLRVGKEFLALVDYKGSGMVVKLPKARVAEVIESGVGQSLPHRPSYFTTDSSAYSVLNVIAHLTY